MTLIRKVFWPAAIALGLLVFLGAVGGTGIGTARADNNDRGDYCKILGPSTILVGGHYLYMAVVDGTTWRDDHEVSVDNIVGNSKITSAVIADEDRGHGHGGRDNSFSVTDYNNYGHHDDVAYDTTVGPANVVDNLTDYSPLALDDQVRDDLMAQFAPDGTPGTGFDILQNLNNCGLSTANALARIYDDGILAGSVCAVVTSGATATPVVGSCLPFGTSGNYGDLGTTNCGGTATFCTTPDELYGDHDIDCPTGATCTIAAAIVSAVVAAVQADISNIDLSCRDIAIDAGKAAVGAGASELVGLQFQDFTRDLCYHDWKPFDHDQQNFIDDVVIVDVTCSQAGNFDITFTNEDRTAEAISMNVRCLGAPSSKSTVTATPASIEIVPAVGNVSNSFINVTLLDADGNQAGPADVDFITDRCSVESSSVDTVAEWNAIAPLFSAFNTSVPTTAAAIQASAAGTTQPDSTRGQDSMVAVGLTGTTPSTRAGTILMCDPQAAPGATPGVATVTVVIDSSASGVVAGTANDIVLTVKVTVVGPPASITVAASPTSVRCGEKATITATVKDAIGQNVSEHTRVEAVTNAGGTLAGTGAVANQAGLVSPISSTVSETFSGVATFFLLTSEQHTGPYEVVVTSGGQGALGAALGGVFSTPPVSAQTTVTCSLPAAPVAPSTAAPAPTVSAPRTGSGGITAPNTGDAGLAGRDSGRNWTEFAAFGALAAVSLAGVVVFRKRNND